MSNETFFSHLGMEEEWDTMMEKYKLRDWRYPQQMRQNKISDSEEVLEEVTSEVEDMERPPYTYSELAAMAIRNSPETRCTVQEVCHFVEAHFPYYRNLDIKLASATFATVLSSKSDFVKTANYVMAEKGNRRHYYSFRPVGREKKKKTV